MRVCAFFGFSQLGGLGSQVGQLTISFDIPCGSGGRLKMFAPGRFRYSYAIDTQLSDILQERASCQPHGTVLNFKVIRQKSVIFFVSEPSSPNCFNPTWKK